ncbi:MAG: tetratricopeptide repeat protein [Roseobacter sp.]
MLTAFCTIAGPPSAQDFSEILPVEYSADYEALLSDPGNLDRLFQLARRAELDANQNGAVSGYRFAMRLYERMLLISPTLTQVMLRLGEIHFRLEEYTEAGSYFRKAVEDAALPEDVRATALRYLDEIDKELSQSRFSGSFTGGVKYQSNPSLEDEPLLFPQPQGSDFNIFAGIGFTHIYDPDWQSGHTLETTFAATTQQYFSLSEIDSTSVDLTFGPRFKFDTYGIGGTSLRPYLVFAADSVENEWYSIDTGFGLQATTAPTQMMRFSINLNVLEKRYNSSQGAFSNANLLDGDEYNAGVSADFRLSPRLDLGVGLYWRERTFPEANTGLTTDSQSEKIGVDLLLRYRHAPLFDFGTGDWYLNLFASHEQTRLSDRFDGDLTVFRQDWENKIVLSSEIPVNAAASVVTGVGHTGQNSTFEGTGYSNWEAYIGYTQRF